MPECVNMPKFWIWQGSKYASVTQRSGYVRICLDRVLNILGSKYAPGFWKWQGLEDLHRVLGVCHNMSEYV